MKKRRGEWKEGELLLNVSEDRMQLSVANPFANFMSMCISLRCIFLPF